MSRKSGMVTIAAGSCLLGLIVGACLAAAAVGLSSGLLASLKRRREQTLTMMAVVRANGEWQNSGIFLRKGQRVLILANGEWSHDDGISFYDADGVGVYDDNALLPTAKTGMLIGKIGDGQPFIIGTNAMFVAAHSGHLYLSMNDARRAFVDNQGKIAVQIMVEGR